MSKNLQQGKNAYLNYLTLANGCKILQKGLRTLPHLNPQNILTQNVRQMWLSHELPATCIIDLRNLIDKPIYFNRIGFKCWHQYQSNPKLIQIQTSQDSIENISWNVLAKIRLELVDGWQNFKIPKTYSKNLTFLKITILENHQQKEQEQDLSHQKNFRQRVYLNQISMGLVQEVQDFSKADSKVEQISTNNQNIVSRQKTFSDYRKLTSSQKEIKRLSDKVKHLSAQNQIIKKTMDQQNTIILKLQQAIHSLTENISKLQQIQQIQQLKIKDFQRENHGSNYKNNKRNSKHKNSQQIYKKTIHQFFNDQSQIGNSVQSKHPIHHSVQSKHNSKHNSRQKPYSRHNSVYQQQQSVFSKKNSAYRSGKAKSKSIHLSSNQSKSKKTYEINPNIEQSQNSLSQYEDVRVDQRAYQIRTQNTKEKGSSKQKTYIPMLQKLQQLIMLRDEKKNKLKTHKKHKHSKNMPRSSDQQEEQDDIDLKY